MNTLKRISQFAAALLTLGLSGCWPEVAWLPDSSGFIYVDSPAPDEKRENQLVHFDLATRKNRVISAKTMTAQPGLSPDGKKIALADCTVGVVGDPKIVRGTIQVAFINLQGKELERSKKFTWYEHPAAPDEKIEDDTPLVPPCLYWSANGQHILISARGRIGLYDVNAGTLKFRRDGIAVSFGGSPFRPDGAGFLLVRFENKVNASDYYFCNLMGKEQKLRIPDNCGVHFPLAVTLWNKNVAMASMVESTIELDTGKLEVRLKRGEPVMAADDRPIVARYPLGDGVNLHSVIVPGPPQNDLLAPHVRLELLLPGQKKARVLFAQTAWVTATPSPNGQWLALRSSEGIFVVSRNGQAIEVPALK